MMSEWDAVPLEFLSELGKLEFLKLTPEPSDPKLLPDRSNRPGFY